MHKYIFFIFFCFFINFIYSDETIIFKQLIGNNPSEQKWTVKKDKDALKLTCIEDEGITTIDASLKYEIKKYSFKAAKEKIEYSLEIKNKKVVATALVNGKKINTSHSISVPWIQQFSFGFKNFLLSKEKSMDFCLINPQNFSLQKMFVKKKAVEPLSIEGKKYNSQKVVIKVSGFKSAFWEAELWFDKDTGDFLKYKANSGPSTPLTTIWFSSRK